MQPSSTETGAPRTGGGRRRREESQLQPGDRRLLSTGGITEAENAQLEEFGDERLLQAARQQDGSALDVQRAIMEQVSAFCGGNFRDDSTLLVLRIS
jgi:serine phosphatase RsbU (regulator of sigma subunit)